MPKPAEGISKTSSLHLGHPPQIQSVEIKKPIPPIRFIEFNTVKPEDLKDEDTLLQKKHFRMFQEPVDWMKFGEYYPFNYRGPHQRPKVVDFLASIGMLESNNKSDVRYQMDGDLIRKAIHDFDASSVATLIPIQVIHILPCDSSISYTSEHINRMTPLMLRFLNSIGERIQISKA